MRMTTLCAIVRGHRAALFMKRGAAMLHVSGAAAFAMLGAMVFATLSAAMPTAAAAQQATELPPGVIPHSEWESRPPLGYAADANRRNLHAGDRLTFRDLIVTVLETIIDTPSNDAANDSNGANGVNDVRGANDANGAKDESANDANSANGAADAIAGNNAADAAVVRDAVRLRLESGNEREERTVREGAAFNWGGYHVAIVAVYGPGELGGGLTAVEVATLDSLPAEVAASTVAGGAELRLRIPHEITHVTLHHTGSVEPLRPEDDPAQKLRGLQSWGASDRNWWDVPYHFLIDLDGRVYEGRDWRYMGETNTTYDPAGHFLISVIGNYGMQEATAAQVEAIADLMAWAITRFDLPLDRLGGHYDYADTSCPGEHLKQYLEDGTFRRLVEERLVREER